MSEPLNSPPTQLGVPAQFRIPESARAAYGAHPFDQRGAAYYLATGALAASILSVGLVFLLMFVAGGASLIPATLGLILGIMALRKLKESPLPYFRKQAKTFAVWSLVLSSLGLLLGIASLIFTTWLFSNIGDCDQYDSGSTLQQDCQSITEDSAS
ncbi:MAG: hypothetical protein Q3974_03345 [Rothia sp. (in: high G+C Gram-positive bacteria)]|nr:hypothetical protein [Rothia sp. (in: high G+C Gram-positive bacteria)]